MLLPFRSTKIRKDLVAAPSFGTATLWATAPTARVLSPLLRTESVLSVSFPRCGWLRASVRAVALAAVRHPCAHVTLGCWPVGTLSHVCLLSSPSHASILRVPRCTRCASSTRRATCLREKAWFTAAAWCERACVQHGLARMDAPGARHAFARLNGRRVWIELAEYIVRFWLAVDGLHAVRGLPRLQASQREQGLPHGRLHEPGSTGTAQHREAVLQVSPARPR